MPCELYLDGFWISPQGTLHILKNLPMWLHFYETLQSHCSKWESLVWSSSWLFSHRGKSPSHVQKRWSRCGSAAAEHLLFFYVTNLYSLVAMQVKQAAVGRFSADSSLAALFGTMYTCGRNKYMQPYLHFYLDGNLYRE